jgi:hypothetical protein
MNVQPGQAQIDNRQSLPSNSDTLSVQPLSIWRQVLDLPRQYFDALVDPTSMFTEGKRRASWSLILFQLIGVAILLIVVVTFFNLLTFLVKGASTSQLGSAVTSFALRLLVLIVIFLVYVAIQFLVVRAFRGTGSFREQLYVSLLLVVPMGIVLSIMAPAAGLNFVFAAYALGLSVAAVRAVHNLSRNQAIVTMLVPVLLGLGVYFTLVAVGVIKLAPVGPV